MDWIGWYLLCVIAAFLIGTVIGFAVTGRLTIHALNAGADMALIVALLGLIDRILRFCALFV